MGLKNFAYCIHYHKARNKSCDDAHLTCYASVKRIFNNQSFCTPSCPERVATNNQTSPKTPYLDPIIHSDIYTDLIHVLDMYTSQERLVEFLHGDCADTGTQHNEAVNNTTITMSRKAINYATSTSFSDCVRIIIGIHNLGHLDFYKTIH